MIGQNRALNNLYFCQKRGLCSLATHLSITLLESESLVQPLTGHTFLSHMKSMKSIKHTDG